MDPVLRAFGEKVAALAPTMRPGLLEASRFKLMRTRAPAASRAPMPGISAKTSMVHPSMQQPSESMTPKKWRQVAKDIPVAALAGGLGYGIGRTLAEVIGEKTVGHALEAGGRPGWVRALPIATAVLSAGGAFAASRAREAMKERRDKA